MGNKVYKASKDSLGNVYQLRFFDGGAFEQRPVTLFRGKESQRGRAPIPVDELPGKRAFIRIYRESGSYHGSLILPLDTGLEKNQFGPEVQEVGKSIRDALRTIHGLPDKDHRPIQDGYEINLNDYSGSFEYIKGEGLLGYAAKITQYKQFLDDFATYLKEGLPKESWRALGARSAAGVGIGMPTSFGVYQSTGSALVATTSGIVATLLAFAGTYVAKGRNKGPDGVDPAGLIERLYLGTHSDDLFVKVGKFMEITKENLDSTNKVFESLESDASFSASAAHDHAEKHRGLVEKLDHLEKIHNAPRVLFSDIVKNPKGLVLSYTVPVRTGGLEDEKESEQLADQRAYFTLKKLFKMALRLDEPESLVQSNLKSDGSLEMDRSAQLRSFEDKVLKEMQEAAQKRKKLSSSSDAEIAVLLDPGIRRRRKRRR